MDDLKRSDWLFCTTSHAWSLRHNAHATALINHTQTGWALLTGPYMAYFSLIPKTRRGNEVIQVLSSWGVITHISWSVHFSQFHPCSLQYWNWRSTKLRLQYISVVEWSLPNTLWTLKKAGTSCQHAMKWGVLIWAIYEWMWEDRSGTRSVIPTIIVSCCTDDLLAMNISSSHGSMCIASVRIQILTIVKYVSPDISSYMTNRLGAYDMECNLMLYTRSVRVYGELLHVNLHWQTGAQEYSLIVYFKPKSWKGWFT